MGLRSLHDTIVAPITGAQRAAVAIVRLSGTEAWQIGSQIFDRWPATVEPMRAIYGRFVTGEDGLVLPFAHGHSYTGDQSVELSIHGSPAAVQALLAVCVACGARSAEPGEFTQRAFMNGRIDLTQAEGIRDVIESRVDAQLRSAYALRDGELSGAVKNVRELLIAIVARIEASIDFSEEVGELDRGAANAELKAALGQLDMLIERARFAQVMKDGYRIALVGLPNSGKSTLLNALLGSERAIVTDIAGTTRDTIEEMTSLGGVPCVLIDTAGLRETNDAVERIGIDRARAAARLADEVWYLYDLSVGWSSADSALFDTLSSPLKTKIGTKCDLVDSVSEDMAVSALSMQGMPLLETLVASRIGDRESSLDIFVNARHAPLLAHAHASTLAAQNTINSDSPPDLAVVQLTDAIRTLGEITGETATPDMIDELFASFCIGK